MNWSFSCSDLFSAAVPQTQRRTLIADSGVEQLCSLLEGLHVSAKTKPTPVPVPE